MLLVDHQPGAFLLFCSARCSDLWRETNDFSVDQSLKNHINKLGQQFSLDLLCWRSLELKASQGSDTFCTGKREIRQTAGAIQAEA